MPSVLISGLYERLVSQELRRLLDEIDPARIDVVAPDPGDAHTAVADYLHGILERALRAIPEEERLTRQAELCNALLGWLRLKGPTTVTDDGEELVAPLEVLREVRALTRGAAFSPATPRPLVPLDSADLMVNARGEPSVGNAIAREIHSSDRIDLLCAFVRWTGLRLMQPALESHRLAGRPLRVITTVYTGSTERRALDWLASIGAEIKVSYDTRTTRLHAKAWLFERLSGYSTAFIGSSNLTHSAMLDGLEWNVRLAEVSTPQLIDKFRAAFEGYWADPDYESYDPARDADRFDRAVSVTPTVDQSRIFPFDLQPWPFQQEMLQRLATERERHHRHRNLVVAATGTGKTMVAAFDYRRLRQSLGNPSLLFIAHRREILAQSLTTYRAVLKEGTFGELFVDGHRPDEGRHVFASVQSLAQVSLDAIAPGAFDVVVVDEFHHAAAPTYGRLLSHLKPRVLLGLTATPERADGQSVLEWFENRIAVEMRLWEALERGILCPFQYFGVHDNTDLSQLKWTRRKYDVAALQNLYTGDQARVGLVVKAITEKIANPRAMRALGFCVSVAHAEFMAREFARRGLPALAVSGDTGSDDRDAALRDLRSGAIAVIFCVDLFNEGIDVPEIDTVLFLRPTESALIFLQQLGRGLRRADSKSCLTVLDFIGSAHRRFRFDLKFQALQGGSRSDVTREIVDGFPHLPSGCSIQLDRVASRIVLDNVRQSLGTSFASLASELQAQVQERRRSGHDPNGIGLADFLRDANLEVQDVYRSNGWTWSRLRREVGLATPPEGRNDERLSRALPRLLHLDDPGRLAAYRRAVRGQLSDEDFELDSPLARSLTGLHFVLWRVNETCASLRESMARLRDAPAFAAECAELLDVLEDRATHLVQPLDQQVGWPHQIPLAVHARASLVEILAACGRLSFTRRTRLRQGVDFDPVTKTDLFFVTLEKTEKHYSPSTMYRDYAISPVLFHWESQSTTSVESPTGQRYLSRAASGTNVVLFVRHRKHEAGRTAAYTCLGAADYVSHKGSRPISITWRLRTPMPADFFREAKVASG